MRVYLCICVLEPNLVIFIQMGKKQWIIMGGGILVVLAVGLLVYFIVSNWGRDQSPDGDEDISRIAPDDVTMTLLEIQEKSGRGFKEIQPLEELSWTSDNDKLSLQDPKTMETNIPPDEKPMVYAVFESNIEGWNEDIATMNYIPKDGENARGWIKMIQQDNKSIAMHCIVEELPEDTMTVSCGIGPGTDSSGQ